MSRLARIALFPLKLAGALRRNGPDKVWRFASTMIGRYGFRRTLAYGFSTPARRREQMAELERLAEAPRLYYSDPVAPVIEYPNQLDAAFTIQDHFWRDRLDAGSTARKRAALAAAPRDGGVAGMLRLLVEGEDAAAAELTGRAFGSEWACTSNAPETQRLIAGLREDDWVVFLRAGDQPAPELRSRLAEAAVRNAPVDVLSFDMTASREGGRVFPIFLPGQNAWAARYTDVGFGRYAFRAGALREGDTSYGRLAAWLAERLFSDARDRWRHVAQPLVHVSLSPPQIVEARVRAKHRAEAEYFAKHDTPERVSIIICTHERGHLLRQLVRALDLDDPRIANLVVIANNVSNPIAVETLNWLRGLSKAHVLVRNEPFNFSKLSNAGAAGVTGDRLLFLNDDVLPLGDEWLEPLLIPLRDPAVGVSGPLLIYPNERVQHAGIYLGYRGGAGHTLRHARLPTGDYLTYASAPREVSAVTGAVMMVRRDVFEALNGFDEFLATYLQDVDLCLRATAVGFSSVFTPLSILLHMESVTMLSMEGGIERLSDQRGREREHFLRRWPLARLSADPFHNANFDLEDETLHRLSE